MCDEDDSSDIPEGEVHYDSFLDLLDDQAIESATDSDTPRLFGQPTPLAPLDPGIIKDFTYDEWHSVALGLIGIWLGRGSYRRTAFTLALLVLLGFQPPQIKNSVGWRVITSEPWYFVGSLLLNYTIGQQTQR